MEFQIGLNEIEKVTEQKVAEIISQREEIQRNLLGDHLWGRILRINDHQVNQHIAFIICIFCALFAQIPKTASKRESSDAFDLTERFIVSASRHMNMNLIMKRRWLGVDTTRGKAKEMFREWVEMILVGLYGMITPTYYDDDREDKDDILPSDDHLRYINTITEEMVGVVLDRMKDVTDTYSFNKKYFELFTTFYMDSKMTGWERI